MDCVVRDLLFGIATELEIIMISFAFETPCVAEPPMDTTAKMIFGNLEFDRVISNWWPIKWKWIYNGSVCTVTIFVYIHTSKLDRIYLWRNSVCPNRMTNVNNFVVYCMMSIIFLLCVAVVCVCQVQFARISFINVDDGAQFSYPHIKRAHHTFSGKIYCSFIELAMCYASKSVRFPIYVRFIVCKHTIINAAFAGDAFELCMPLMWPQISIPNTDTIWTLW